MMLPACSIRSSPEPTIQLLFEGAVVAAGDSKPLSGAYVTFSLGTGNGERRSVAGTRTDQRGRFWLRVDIQGRECAYLQLAAATVGLDPSWTRGGQLQCTPQCQRIEFALAPPSIGSHNYLEPRVSECRP